MTKSRSPSGGSWHLADPIEKIGIDSEVGRDREGVAVDLEASADDGGAVNDEFEYVLIYIFDDAAKIIKPPPNG